MKVAFQAGCLDKLGFPATMDFLFKALKIARQKYARHRYYGRISIGLVIKIDKNYKLRVGPQELFPSSEQPKVSIVTILATFNYDDLSEPRRTIQFFLPEFLLKAGLVLSRDIIEEIINRIVS
jgi:hypothetical protein